MNLVIHNMQMPTACINCPIYNNEFGQCNLIPNSTFYGDDYELYNPLEERCKDCPLEEVPE